VASRNWSRDETLVAFSLYCRLPFGRLHGRNPEIRCVAGQIGRTPSALAMKCCNFASLDDGHQQRGVKGLQNAAALDKQIWAEFQANPEALSFEAATALAQFEVRPLLPAEADLPDVEGLDAARVVRVRVNQRFFRDMILTGYNSNCAVCGLGLCQLLVASHIVPWTTDRTLRMNPRNGLCLCGTHDRAYECGVLRVAGDYSIRIAVASAAKKQPAVNDWLLRYDGRQIQLPIRWLPDPVLLDRKLALVSVRAV
jgi:putative restriction endonuclease